jgi:hypothetical protein
MQPWKRFRDIYLEITAAQYHRAAGRCASLKCWYFRERPTRVSRTSRGMRKENVSLTLFPLAASRGGSRGIVDVDVQFYMRRVEG